MERIVDKENKSIEAVKQLPPFQRVMLADTSREWSPEEEKEYRKQYFEGQELKDDEYMTEDYEIMCKVCKTRRFYQHNNFIVYGRCKHIGDEIAEKRRQEEELERKRKKMEQLKKLRNASLLGDRYANASFETLDLNRPDDFITAVKRCKTYCEKWEEIKRLGQGIYFYGDVGTGKSLLTACIGNYLLNRLVPVLFTNFFEISKEIKRTWNYSNNDTESDFIERLTNVDLLIIDDIGTEIMVKNGEITWLQEKIYDVINTRYIKRKPTIFSSNESLPDLVEKCGLMKKTVDRIASMSNAKIKLQGSSYRLNEQKNSAIF